MPKATLFFIITLIIIALGSCGSNDDLVIPIDPVDTTVKEFIKGADLSYVNEMLDCGAMYFSENNEQLDPYKIFSAAGTEMVRVRLWHNPGWTAYSNFEDVKKTIALAKAEGMQILLNFHYSDDWADPSKQKVPASWLPVVNDTPVLADSLYNYTYQVLSDLATENLLPEIVQLGNEINAEILQDPNGNYNSINWNRNAALLNTAIQAVRDAEDALDEKIEIMLHIAQPENAIWWFEQASSNGLTDYDWIGISYYPVWSDFTLDNISQPIQTLVNTYQKKLMVVETAYPFTLDNNDAANNILGNDALIDGYPATQQGQYDFLKKLHQRIVEGGGEGMIYWEPAWVSTDCNTQWAQGSHWDNATLFDHNNKAVMGMKYFSEN